MYISRLREADRETLLVTDDFYCREQITQNTGNVPLRFLEMFQNDRFADVSLNQWMALTPHELVQDHLHADQELIGALRKEKRPIVE